MGLLQQKTARKIDVETVWCDIMLMLASDSVKYTLWRSPILKIIDKIRYKWWKTGPLREVMEARKEYHECHQWCLNVKIED